MEKRLRSLLQSSAEKFLISATQQSFKSSKQTLKQIIHSITTSSNLKTSLPHSLCYSISHAIDSLQNQSIPGPSKSPPTKRCRRSSRNANSMSCNDNDNRSEDNAAERKQKALEDLQIYSHVALLCITHPRNVFSSTELLPAAQLLHDNLIIFESDSVLSLEIASLCESWWKNDLYGKEMLISQLLPFLISRSLTVKKKADVHRVYSLRDAFTLFDFDDDSIEDLKFLLIRCVISPLYLKTEDGRKFLAVVFGLSKQMLKEVLAMIKSQISFERKSMLEAYGDVLYRAWKGIQDGFREDIESGFLQVLIEGAIHANSRAFAASIRRVLAGFVNQRTTPGVEKMLFNLAEPVLFRSLQAANSNVRQNSLHLLLDLFPLEDPDATKEVKDTLLDKQFFLMEKLLVDDCPDMRVVAVEGCCRILHLFWELIPSSTITKLITIIFNDISHDVCNEVRLATVNGVIYLLGNPLSHEVLKVLLPRLGHLMQDNLLSVRLAVADLLLLLRDIRTFQFNKVLGLDVLLSTLANDQSQVAQKITRLLMPSYFPLTVNIEEACNRCVILVKRSPVAGARFCEFAFSEGAPLESLMELVKVFIKLVLSHDMLEEHQIDGILVAISYLCKDVATVPCYKKSLKELFAGDRMKCMLAAASTGRAQSSVFEIVSTVSPDNVVGLLEECMKLVSKCKGLSEDEERQAEVRSAHKLLLSSYAFDDMLEAVQTQLEKVVYRCHVKFGTEILRHHVSSGKQKKAKPAVKISGKWKYASGRKASSFQEDYAIAVGIAWQIKDLLTYEDSRKAILGSQNLELLCHALKVIAEVSIAQCMYCDYMDAYPVLAYTDLALQMTIQTSVISRPGDSASRKNDGIGSTSSSAETVLDQATEHLLNCTDGLFGGCLGNCSKISPSSKHDKSKMAQSREKQLREPQMEACCSNDNGSVGTGKRIATNKVNILTAVLKFIVDSTALGFLSLFVGRCVKFASGYVQYIISALGQPSRDKLQVKYSDFKGIFLSLKSSFSYATKLINLVCRDSSEASPPPTEAFELANDLINLMCSVELYMGSVYTARLLVVAKAWLPDLILALVSGCILNQCQVEGMRLTASDYIKVHFPSWLLILARTELDEVSKISSEEDDDRISKPEEFPEFKTLMEMIVSSLKVNTGILDTVGVVFMTGSVVGLERKDFGLLLGLLRFVCVKLIGTDNREWNGLDTMLVFLPELYPRIEKEIEEQSEEDERQKLLDAKLLLEPVWMHHVFETGRFSVMEQEMEFD